MLLDQDGNVPLNYFTFSATIGDQLAPWLLEKMTGRTVVEADRSRPHYMMSGSVISQATASTVVWGAGCYGSEERADVEPGVAYAAVRGPLTRSKLAGSHGFGARVPAIYGDPLLLVPSYFWPDVRVQHEYGVIVAWSERSWAAAQYGEGVKLIDFSGGDVERALREMLSCRRIVSSTLAGLVLADAYGIPSAWLHSEAPRGGQFTFLDYFASTGRLRRPIQLDLSQGVVSVERLDAAGGVEAPLTHFDAEAFLDACPFLQRHDHGTSGTRRPLSEQPGIASLLPSLGFFGGIEANRLAVACAGPVGGVRLAIPSSVKGQLDLRGIELFRNGKRVAPPRDGTVVDQSSQGLRAVNRSPFDLGGIRTESEFGPWWQVTFDPPVDADEVRVYNRLDALGARNRSVTVSVLGASREVATQFAVDSDVIVGTTLSTLSSLSGITIDESTLGSAPLSAALRTSVIRALSERGIAGVEAEQQRLLYALLPTHKRALAEKLTDAEWDLLGQLLAEERVRVPRSATVMRAFQHVLRTRPELQRLQHAVNRAGEARGARPVVLTRHGFADLGGLRLNSETHLRALANASAELARHGFDMMVSYGTLLGAVRDGDFIAHDDDIDVLMPLNAASVEEAEEVMVGLHRRLREDGWKVGRPNSYLNFHMTDPELGSHIDVFPLLVHGDRADLHMEKMRLRSLPTVMFLPTKTMPFKGSEIRIPAQPEAFLEERYGAMWNIPDQFYDWTWRLADD